MFTVWPKNMVKYIHKKKRKKKKTERRRQPARPPPPPPPRPSSIREQLMQLRLSSFFQMRSGMSPHLAVNIHANGGAVWSTPLLSLSLLSSPSLHQPHLSPILSSLLYSSLVSILSTNHKTSLFLPYTPPTTRPNHASTPFINALHGKAQPH